MIYIYIYIYHHHYHIVPQAWISLTLSRHDMVMMMIYIYIYIIIITISCRKHGYLWPSLATLLIIWKSGLTDKRKHSFFQVAVVSILLYGCTTWTLTKRLEKKLDGNYTRMLWAILDKSWQQHPTRHQLYGHLPPITKTIQARQTRHAEHCWRSKTSS